MDPRADRFHAALGSADEIPTAPEQPQGPVQVGSDATGEQEIVGDRLAETVRDAFYRLLNKRSGAASEGARHG